MGIIAIFHKRRAAVSASSQPKKSVLFNYLQPQMYRSQHRLPEQVSPASYWQVAACSDGGEAGNQPRAIRLLLQPRDPTVACKTVCSVVVNAICLLHATA